jgi:hypothetical protein
LISDDQDLCADFIIVQGGECSRKLTSTAVLKIKISETGRLVSKKVCQDNAVLLSVSIPVAAAVLTLETPSNARRLMEEKTGLERNVKRGRTKEGKKERRKEEAKRESYVLIHSSQLRRKRCHETVAEKASSSKDHIHWKLRNKNKNKHENENSRCNWFPRTTVQSRAE